MKMASRTLKLRGPQSDADIQISVFAPERDGNSWTCRYEIDWPGEKQSSSASGFDSMQALLLALQKIGIEIYCSDYHKSGNLFWDNDRKGYGFPVPANARDLLIGDDARFF